MLEQLEQLLVNNFKDLMIWLTFAIYGVSLFFLFLAYDVLKPNLKMER